MSDDRVRTRRLAWLSLGAVCVFWSTTFLAIKISLETVPPFLMGGARYVLAGVLLAVIVAARGRPLPARSEWRALAILGFFMMVIGNGGVVWGEQYVPSGLTAVILGTSPFWMVGIHSMMPDGERMHARQWVGLVVGFCGILLLVWPEIAVGGVRAHGFVLGVISLEIACAGWGVGSNYTRRHVMPGDVLGAAALQMFFGGAMMMVVGVVTGEWGHVTLTARTFTAWIYLALIGSVVGFAAYSYALQHLPVAIVSLYNFVTPVLALTLGTLVLGEPFHARMLLAAGVIVAGIVIVGPARTAARPEGESVKG